MKASALGTTALTALALLMGAGPAIAGQKPVLPSGGGFAAGAGAISASGSTLTVTQSSLRGIINWSSFSIGRGGLVQFNNGSGATLNRVTGAQASQIFGTLSATGSLYLLNPNGVLIGKSGVVQTGGSFLASTLDTPDAAFMAGGAVALSGGSAASVRNHGTIAATGGNVFLVARTVLNSGSIAAANGEAGLAAGQQVLLQDSASDPRIFIEAPGGNVTNQGKIAAAAVALKAAGGNVYALAGNNGGQISATGTAVINGHVWLTASGGGSVTAAGQVSAQNADGSGGTVRVAGDAASGSAIVTGTIDVSATAAGKTGGTATVTAATVTLGATAVIDATGDAGGGTVEVGGGLHGADPKVANAQTTIIAAGAKINASATGKGNGGTIAVWSDGTTIFGGSIFALGGPGGGNGGTVETSGKGILDIGPTALVSAAAPNGAAGSWLLDPDSDLDITNASSNVTCSISPVSCSPTANSSTLAASVITNALNAGTDVTILTGNPTGSQQGNITVDSQIALTAAQTVTLTLDAGSGGGTGAVTLNQAITDTGSGGALSLVLNAGGGIAFNSTLSLAGSLSATAGNNSANSPVNITLGSNGFLQVAGAASFTNLSQNGNIILRDATTVGQLRGGVSFVTTGSGSTLSFSNDGGGAGTVLGTSFFAGTTRIEDTSGSISQSGVLRGNGGVSFETDASNATITLDTQTNALNGSVGFTTVGSGGNVRFKNSGGTVLRGLQVGGNLSLIDTSGSISQLATGLQVSGTSTFQTLGSGKAIVLGDNLNKFSGAVKFLTTGSGANATLTNSLATTIDGATAVGGSLSVNTQGQTLALNGVDLGGTLDLSGSGTTTLNTGTYTINGGASAYTFSPAVTTNGTLTFGQDTIFAGAVTLGGDTTLSAPNGNAIALDAQVTGGANALTLSTSGAETLSGITTTSTLTLGLPSSLTLDAGTYTFSNGGTAFASPVPTTTNGTLILGQATSFGGAITLGSDTTFDSSAANANLTFNGTIDASSNGGQALTVSAGSGSVEFAAALGAHQALKSLTVSDPEIDANVTTTGAQTYSGAVTLGSTVTLTTTNNDVTFNSTVDAFALGQQGLTVNAGSGTVTFNGTVGTTALSTLTVTAGTTAINGGSISTTGGISLSGSTGGITLGAPTTLNVLFGGAISLENQVTGGANSLTLSPVLSAVSLAGVTTTGNLTLVGLGQLTLNAGTYTIGNGATTYTFPSVPTITNGLLFFGMDTKFDALTLGSDTVINALGNQNFTFNGAIDGAFALEVQAGSGQINLNQAVGAGTPLTSFQAQGGAIVFSGSTATITTTGGAGISLISTENGTALTLPASLNAGTGAVILTSSGAISQTGGTITAGVLDTVSSNGTEITNANTAIFTGGNSTSGDITVSDTAPALQVESVINRVGNISITNNGGALTVTNPVSTLLANGAISLSALNGALTVDSTVAAGSGSIGLTASGSIGENANGALNTSGLLSISSGSGTNLASGITVGSFTGTDTSASGITLANTASTLTVIGVTQTGGGNVAIANTGNLTVLAPVTTAANGNVTLISIGGALTVDDVVSAGGSGAVDLASTGAGSSMAVTGPVSSTTGAIRAATDGTLTLGAAGSLATGAAGNAIVLSAGGDFINDAGASVLSAGAGGRWLVYSAAPAGDSFGGLDSHNTAIWNATLASLPPANVTQSGNRYLFAQQPTATFTANTVSKTYGTTVDLSTAYTLTGLQPGVAGAYLGDSAATAFTGAPSLSSAGAASNANAGTYGITITEGSLASPSGYAVAFANGELIVGQATLTYVANPVVRLLGEPNPVFTGRVTGLNGATGVGGTPVFTSTATIASGPGRYAIDGSGISGGNYAIVQAPGNATALAVEAFGMPNVLPPTSTQLLGQQAPAYRAASAAPLLANLAPLAGCRVTPEGNCLQPLAASSFAPLLPGSDANRAAPVKSW